MTFLEVFTLQSLEAMFSCWRYNGQPFYLESREYGSSPAWRRSSHRYSTPFYESFVFPVLQTTTSVSMYICLCLKSGRRLSPALFYTCRFNENAEYRDGGTAQLCYARRHFPYQRRLLSLARQKCTDAYAHRRPPFKPPSKHWSLVQGEFGGGGVKATMTDAEDRLMVDLFRGYNSLVQPVRNKSELPMIVKIAMQLVLLINVVGNTSTVSLLFT